jgi:DNA-binding transcriptional regulator YdaS (Cro superfamily)
MSSIERALSGDVLVLELRNEDGAAGAEHAQRHAGQIITTVKILRGLASAPR